MTVVTVTPNAMPAPGTYAEMLESLLAELGFDRTLTGKIANTIEYEIVDFDQFYELIDSMLETEFCGLLLNTLINFYEQMAEDANNWRPTTVGYYRSTDEYDQMQRAYPALNDACGSLNRLITEFNMAYYSH